MNATRDNTKIKCWKKMDLWQIKEAILLLLGISPSETLFINRDRYPHQADPFWEDFDYLAQMTKGSIETGKLKIFKHYPNHLYSEVIPKDFLQWARAKDLLIPDDLHDLCVMDTEIEIANEKIDERKMKNTGKALRVNQIAKQLCQAIARTLWDIYPEMKIADMKKHNSVLEYGGGKHYSGKNTLQDWLSEVDPRKPEAKTGRPPIKQ